MHVPNWVLATVASYLTSRSMILSHAGATAGPRDLPGGFGQGVWLGGILFIVKFNGACLRPSIPRPLSGNTTVKVKYIDDATQAPPLTWWPPLRGTRWRDRARSPSKRGMGRF